MNMQDISFGNAVSKGNAISKQVTPSFIQKAKHFDTISEIKPNILVKER